MPAGYPLVTEAISDQPIIFVAPKNKLQKNKMREDLRARCVEAESPKALNRAIQHMPERAA
jgi:hypothetical protein